MIDYATAVLPSPTVGRNFFEPLKSLRLLGFSAFLAPRNLREPTQRSANTPQRGVENPWNLFADRSARPHPPLPDAGGER